MALDPATLAIAVGGFFSGGYAAWQSRKAQAISEKATERAQEWTTMRDTVQVLKEERDGLRQHLEGIEARHLAETEAILVRHREDIAQVNGQLEAERSERRHVYDQLVEERQHSRGLEAEVRKMRHELTAFWDANERRKTAEGWEGEERRTAPPPPTRPESA